MSVGLSIILKQARRQNSVTWGHKQILVGGHKNFNTVLRIRESSKTKLRQTRSNSEYFPTYCRINLTMQSIKYKGPVQWNKIPSSIREVKSLTTFKLLLQDFLKKND